MADARKKKKQETYASKHDFHVIPISQLNHQIKLCERAKIPLAIVGPSGIGKSAIVRQVAKELTNETGKNYECRTIIASQTVPEDWMGIPIPDMEAREVKFLKLESLPKDPNSHGILFLDEINQADMTVLRAIFQLLGERRIGTYELPPGWTMVAAMNPDGENYGTTKPSPALRRRMSWLEVKFDESAFLDYADNNGFHPAVVEFLRRSPAKMLNEAALKNDKVFACPASWERFSDIVHGLKDGESSSHLVGVGAGLVGLTYTKDFIRFFDEHRSQIDPKDVIEKYHKAGVRPRVQKAAKMGRTDILMSISNALVFLMMDMSVKDKKFKQRSRNFADFFIDLPDDTAVAFLGQLTKKFTEKGLNEEVKAWKNEVSKTSEGASKYIRMLQLTKLMSKESASAAF